MIPLFALFACVPSETPDDVTVEAAGIAAEVDCSGVTTAFGDLVPSLDAAIERVELARLIARNYDELLALTLRSASSVTSASERADNAVEALLRMEEAARLTTDIPELAPALFGFDQLNLTTARGAAAAVPAFLEATRAAGEDVAEAERAFFMVELQFPAEYAGTLEACGFAIPALPEPAFDTDPVGGALLANVEEAQALVAAIEMADGVVELWLENIYGYAEQSASGTLGDEERSDLQFRFQRAVSRIELVTAVAVFNDYPIADGRVRARQTLTELGNEHAEIIAIYLPDLHPSTLGVGVAALDLSTSTGGAAALDSIQDAIEIVHDNQAHLDAVGAVLELEAARLTLGK